MTRKMTERRERALNLKDATLRLAKEHGTEIEVSGYPIIEVELDVVRFWLSNLGGRHQLDIRSRDASGAKVFNASWSSDNDLEVISFRRGPWEDQLLGFGKEPLH